MHALISVGLSLAMEGVWLPITLAISKALNPSLNEPVPIAAMIVFSFLGRILPGALTYAAISMASTLDSREALRRRELTASQLEGQLLQSQLGALKMQVHPHFLFNTLHAISSLVHTNPDSADRMISRSSDLLRLTFDRSGIPGVSLQEELEFLQKYLEIEQTRFPDRCPSLRHRSGERSTRRCHG